MPLSIEQVEHASPDAGSLAAGRKLASTRHWRSLGLDERAAWGECQGSAVYQVAVDLVDPAYKCSCPSRKFPCKHAIGLMLMVAGSDVPSAHPPAWVTEWLDKRGAAAARRTDRATEPVADTVAQKRRADKRQQRVLDGLEGFRLWLADLIRAGLAGLDSRPARFWEDQAARLVDAQAAGLASRVRRLAGLPGSGEGWPARMLAQLGKLSLAAHAMGRIDQLDAALQEDLRQFVGWNVSKDDLTKRGESLDDDWFVLGQWVDDGERLRVQRTWLQGQRSGRIGLVLQFAPSGVPFAEEFVPGSIFDASVQFYPSAAPQRIRIAERRTQPTAIQSRPLGFNTLTDLLESFATDLARQPWLDSTAGMLHDVFVSVDPAHGWRVHDRSGKSLSLRGRDHWRLLAISGGQPIDLACEWDGEVLLPLGLHSNGVWFTLWRG